MIEFVFSFALFINALLFIPQAIKIFKNKTAEGVSLLTFSGFLLIQLAIVLHGVIKHDYLLIIGYLLSMATCGLIIVLTLIYRKGGGVSSGAELGFKDILEQLPGHIYWKNREGVHLGCNATNWKDFGLTSLSEIKGKTDYDLFPKQQADQLRIVDEEVMRTGQLKVKEELLTVGEKSSLYLSYKSPLKNKYGQTIGILGTSLDITHSKQEVMEELNMLENIIAVMPGNVYWMNKKGIYLGCNDNEAKAVGLQTRQEIIGKRNADILGFVIPEFLDEVNKKVMESGNLVIAEEPAVLNDGTQATFLSSKVPLRNQHGEITGMIGISIDITERKEAESALKAAKEAAEAANEAKTEFLSNMRHDLRTPFTGILGLAGLMAEQETDPEKKENLSYIAESAQALLNHVNEILEFVQVESGQLPILEKQFDLYALLNHTLNMLLPSAKDKRLNLTLNVSKDVPQFLLGDAVRTQRILINLISNAIKFTEKGYVKVEVQKVDKLETKIVLNFVVENTGPGIPEDKRDIIFERFNRLTSSYSGIYPGKGLGLKIVRQFLEEIGGQIYLTSELGKGTVFKVLIPYQLPLLPNLATHNDANEQSKSTFASDALSTKTPTSVKSKKPSTNRSSSKTNKILLVEDHTIAAKIAESILSELSCEVDIAETGKAALSLVEKNQYDLILMDIGLPDTDGCAVTKQIRSHRLQSIAQIPIVALTAHAESDEKQRCLDVGMNMVITKPLTKKWADSVLKTFIPQREKQKRQMKEAAAKATVNKESAEKVVDVEYAKTLLGDNETLVYEMLTMLVDSFPEEVKALKEAYQQKNWEELRNLAHKLKGGSSYCGTLRLKSVCSELESYIKSGLTAKIPEFYQKLLSEIEAVQKFVKNQLAV